MANAIQIIRPMSVYVNGGKAAEITSGSYKINTGREAVITDGGYSGHSAGAITCTISAKTLVATTTTGFSNLYKTIQARDHVSVAVPVEGQFHQMVGAITEIGAEWDHSKGSAMGDWTFQGGEPQPS